MGMLIAMWRGIRLLFGVLDRHDGSITALATVAIVGLTFVYVRYSKKQWTEMQRSNEISRDALTSVQRAFLVCNDLSGRRNTVPDGSASGFHVNWNFTMPCDNAGATTANVVAQSGGGDLLSTEPSETQFLGKEVDRTSSVIGPKATQNTMNVAIREKDLIGREFAPGEFASMKVLPQLTFIRGHFIWGWISYYDVFAPRTHLHITEFCREVTNLGVDRSKPGAPPFTEDVACKQHNCADEYCEDYKTIVEMSQRR